MTQSESIVLVSFQKPSASNLRTLVCREVLVRLVYKTSSTSAVQFVLCFVRKDDVSIFLIVESSTTKVEDVEPFP